MFDWNDIRIYLAVADEGSTLAASRVLGINQTTVSRRMHALERCLGLKLFERDTRGYCLTTLGRSMLDVARAMDTAAQDVHHRAENLTRDRSGRLRVSAASSVMEHWVVPLTTAFRRRFEGVSLEIDYSGRQVDLLRGEADVAFRASDAIDEDTLIARKLGMVQWAVYCSKSYVREYGLPRSWTDLEGHELLNYGKYMTERISSARYFEERIPHERITETHNAVSSMAGAICTGAAPGPLPMVEGEARPELVFCFTEPGWSNPLWLVTSRRAYETPLIRDFMKFTGAYGLKDGLTLV